MRSRSFGALGLWLIVAAPLFAQGTLAPPPSPAPPTAPAPYQVPPPSNPYAVRDAGSSPAGLAPPPPPPYVPADPPLRLVNADPENFHVWVRAELLAWWVKHAPLPVPIAVATDGNGNSQTVVGNANNDFGAFVGGRFSLGAWFDEHNNYGFETIFFSLERRSNNQAVFSDDNGNPAIGLSYTSATPGQAGEFIQYLSTPGNFAGNILVTSTLSLWGAEINGAVCALRVGGLEFTALAGFRYVDLHENLYISSGSTDVATGDFMLLNDQFSARNQFYGGQVGARVNWHGTRLSFDATGKLAVGGTQQTVDVQGTSVSSNGGFSPGGFFAQPSNSGHYTASQFGIIPSMELKLSYEFSRAWRLFVGYDFMYWNQVVRPGNQVDRNVNLSQSPLLGNGTLTGPASPGPILSRSDFWAQGITLGFELRF